MSNAINPYLTIDKKYFSNDLEGSFVITKQNLINMPKLKNYFDISLLNNSQINFDNFSIENKIQVGLILFDYYDYTVWVGIKKYINFKKIYDKFKQSELLNYMISLLNKRYFLNKDPKSLIYELDEMPEDLLLQLVKLYFYSKFSKIKTLEPYLESTYVLTDVNINKYQYTKVPDDINFILELFGNWLHTKPSTIPFSPEYGNPLSELIQQKNIFIKTGQIKSSVIGFFEELSKIYTSLVKVLDVKINILDQYGIEVFISLDINSTQTTIILKH